MRRSVIIALLSFMNEVIAKAKVLSTSEVRTTVEVNSYVGQEQVFSGTFKMYRSTKDK